MYLKGEAVLAYRCLIDEVYGAGFRWSRRCETHSHCAAFGCGDLIRAVNETCESLVRLFVAEVFVRLHGALRDEHSGFAAFFQHVLVEAIGVSLNITVCAQCVVVAAGCTCSSIELAKKQESYYQRKIEINRFCDISGFRFCI